MGGKKGLLLVIGFLVLIAIPLVLQNTHRLSEPENGAPPSLLEEREEEEREEAASVEGPHQGQRAPDFSLPDLEGEIHTLSDYRGQVVVINFWNGGCHYCLIELPHLNIIQEEGEGRVQVITVNLGDSPSRVADLWEEEGFETLALLDGEFEVASLYLVRPIPDTLIIDTEGVVVDRLLGARPLEELRRVVERAREVE